MSAVLAEPIPWSNRKIAWAAFALLVGQIGLLLFLAELPAPVSEQPTRASIRIVDPNTLDSEAFEILALRDPTIFALVRPRGFSGEAWLKMQPLPYRMTNRSGAPNWLSPPVSNLAADFARFVRTNVTLPLLVAEKPRPALSTINLRPAVSPIHPVLKIGGDLEGRALISTQALPPLEPNVTQNNCVVRVLVDARGYTLSHVLISSSGSPSADEHALRFAKSARFAPVGRDRLAAGTPLVVSGTLTFQWLGSSESPANLSTNSLPNK